MKKYLQNAEYHGQDKEYVSVSVKGEPKRLYVHLDEVDRVRRHLEEHGTLPSTLEVYKQVTGLDIHPNELDNIAVRKVEDEGLLKMVALAIEGQVSGRIRVVHDVGELAR